ncbi:hypothetical protein ACFL59_02005 [Planctomycetota bacterium]
MLSVVAGLGHIYLRRYLQGAILFLLFATSLDALLLSALWQGEDTAYLLRATSGIGAAFVWLFAMSHVLWLTVLRDQQALWQRKEELVRKALRFYLRDQLAEAERVLQDALRASSDRTDPDLLFLLGAIARREGRRIRARGLLNRCCRADSDGRWRAEVQRELVGLARGDDPSEVRLVEAPRPAPRTPERPAEESASNGLSRGAPHVPTTDPSGKSA